MANMSISAGLGTRFKQQHELEQKERRRSAGIGQFLSYVCPICGQHKNGKSHTKCSKILQQQYMNKNG